MLLPLIVSQTSLCGFSTHIQVARTRDHSETHTSWYLYHILHMTSLDGIVVTDLNAADGHGLFKRLSITTTATNKLMCIYIAWLQGIFVSRIETGGPCCEAGLQVGDKLLSVGSTLVIMTLQFNN